jgi:hypothetical protein
MLSFPVVHVHIPLNLGMVVPKPGVIVWFSHVGFFSLRLNGLRSKKVWFSSSKN